MTTIEIIFLVFFIIIPNIVFIWTFIQSLFTKNTKQKNHLKDF